MATIKNLKALTVSDGNQDYVNVDTVNGNMQLKNGTTLTFYSDDGVTAGVKLTPTGTAPIVSATSPAIANAGTIATAGVSIARVTPAAARTGIIMAAGTVAGQACWVVNESSTTANSIQMDVSGTSNVASGTSCIIYGNQGKHFSWDASTSLWVCNDSLTLGTLINNASATAASLASSGTIATAGVGMARITTSGNVTGIILGAGVIIGQEVIVSNESANTVTFAASSSNVADANTSAVAANCARKFVWNGSLWFRCM